MKENQRNINLISTKFNRPPVARDIYPVDRLLETIDESRNLPFSLISAPAGYGKSTLASSWLTTCDNPNAWLSLDEQDNDPHTFLTYFLATIQSVFPKVGQETLELLKSVTLPPFPIFSQSIINTLNELDQDLIMVLDDYHFIRNKEVHDLITKILIHPPNKLHLVLLTRRDPPFPISTLRGKGQMMEITISELRFTFQETKEFLQKVLNVPVDHNTVNLLEEKTEGWVTGLRLAALAMKHQYDLNWKQFTTKGINNFVGDYFLTEVLSNQTPAVASLLMQTSILDRFCAPLCDAVCLLKEKSDGAKKNLSGEEFIRWLVQTNLFVIPLDAENQWVRYHHLFQELLQKQLKRQYATEDISALHGRASNWFTSENLVEEGIRHALSAGDNLAAARIIEEHRHAILDADRWYVLNKWLTMLPDEIITQRPGLLMAQAGIVRERFKLNELTSILEQCEILLNQKSVDQTLLGEINFYKGILAFHKGESKSSINFIKKAQKLLLPGKFELARADAEAYLGFAYQALGRKKEVIQTLTNKIQTTLKQTSPVITRQIAAISFVHLISGELEQSFQIASQLKEVGKPIKTLYVDLWRSYLQGSIFFQKYDLNAACEHLSLVSENKYIFNTRAAMDCLAALAITYQFRQLIDDSEKILEEQLVLAQHSGDLYNLLIANSTRARLSLLRGNLESAGRWVKTFDNYPQFFSMLFFTEIPDVTQCRVLIAIGSDFSLKTALKELRILWKGVKAIHNTYQMIEIAVLEALALQKQGRTDDALCRLQRAVTLAKPGGWIRPFIEAGTQIADMLKTLIKRKVEIYYLKQILAAFGNDKNQKVSNPHHPSFSPRTQSLIEPLTNRELEILRLVAQRLQNKEIGENLFISSQTVKTHLQNIYQKLNASNRRMAVAIARDLNIL